MRESQFKMLSKKEKKCYQDFLVVVKLIAYLAAFEWGDSYKLVHLSFLNC